MKKILLLVLCILFLSGIASAKSVYVYEQGKGNGNGTFNIYTGVTCTNLNATSPCARYDEGTLRIDMDRDTVKYQVQNNLGTWRYIQYDIPNPTNLTPTVSANPKSIIWMGMYANNTNLRYVMKPHGIKLDIWGNGTPPNNYFNFTYTLSTGVQPKKQCLENESCEIQFYDNSTNELLWTVAYPNMNVNGTDVPLEFRKYEDASGKKISIHAPDLFTNPSYNFSDGWELDPSTYSPTGGGTIYIVDRQNLTQVNDDINNASALQNLGNGEWLLNANLVNNVTTNSFFINDSDVTWLKINSTGATFWYYLTNGKTEINNTKITSWNTSINNVNTDSSSARSAVYASGTSSKMNISNTNISSLGYYASNMYGVHYTTSSNNTVLNSTFWNNYYGLCFDTSSKFNNLNNVTILFSTTGNGILFFNSANNNTVLNSNVNTSGYGIYVSASNNTVSSSVAKSTGSIGIYIVGGSNNTIINSSSTSYVSYGIAVGSNHNNIENSSGLSSASNIVYAGIEVDGSYNTIFNSVGNSSSLANGIRIYNGIHNTILNSTSNSSSGNGLYLYSSANYNNITNTKGTSYSGHGIDISFSYFNNLTSCNATSNTSIGMDLYFSSNNTLMNNTGNSIGNAGIFLVSSNYNNLSYNTGSSIGSAGIFLASSVYNNLSYNNGTSNTGDGIRLESGANNFNLNYNIGISNSGNGISLVSSSNNNSLLSNSGISTSGNGIYLFQSKNNSMINGSYLSLIGYSYSLKLSVTNNTFNNTNFSVLRKIYLDDNLSVFKYDNGNGIWVSTQIISSISSQLTYTNRTLLNWNQSNVSWSEGWSVTNKQIQYNVSGLIPNTQYSIYNGSSIDYNYTTDINGILTPFTINFTTIPKTVKIVLFVPDTSFTVSLPAGQTQAFFNATNKSSKNVNASGQNLTTGFLFITNTGNVPLDFYAVIDSAQPSGVALKGSKDNNPAGESTVPIDDSIGVMFTSLPVSQSQYFWLWVDYSNALPMNAQRNLSVNSSQ